MPSWKIHDKWAAVPDINEKISREINAEIDSIDDPTFHDHRES